MLELENNEYIQNLGTIASQVKVLVGNLNMAVSIDTFVHIIKVHVFTLCVSRDTTVTESSRFLK